jgi:hypothetical protein
LLLLVSALIVISMTIINIASLFSGSPHTAEAAAQLVNGISPEALAQIEALIREKDSRTGIQTKLDSQLIYELKMAHGQQVAEGVAAVETDLPYTDQGRLELDLTANVTDALLDQLRASSAQIVSSNASSEHVRIRAAIEQLESIAALADVIFVQPRQEAVTSGGVGPQGRGAQGKGRRSVLERPIERPGSLNRVEDDLELMPARRLRPGFSKRAARIQNFIAATLSTAAQGNVAGSFSNSTGVGSRSSEGDLTHRAFTARGAFHADGTGIKIGVLSDGVSNLAASQALGDLGPVTIIPGQAGAGDEGTAMLEIIHDLAPGAHLFFATAFNGITSFANNIRALRMAGCDIIVDDVFYFVETPFQDGQAPTVISNTNGGVVIEAVNDVTASGAMYFSSAGNSGNLTDNTSGVWEGDFVDGGATGAPIPAGSAGRVHNFGGQNFNTLTLASAGAPISLYWSDPLGGSSNDYDLFRLNAAGTAVAASSTNIQNGTQDPIEQISQSTANPRIVIVKKTGAADRYLHLNTNRGRLAIATSGQSHGHNHAANAFSCAATPAVGPFPNAHSAANLTETFSSDGPRRIFYQADGTPYTPGNFLSTGGILRQKPDITAADGVSVTGVGGFPSPFFGTSASAPHAAAIAALLKSANPTFTPAQIRTALTSSAIDIEAPGVDRDTGAGIITAFGAMQALGVPGTAFLEFVTITANENPGDGNGTIDAGDGASLLIQLKNSGVVDATQVSAKLTTSTPGIIITQPDTAAYPDLTALGGTGTNTTPYLFTVGSGVSCPATISFTLTVTHTGGGSPQEMSFTVPVGPAAISISSTLDATAPPTGPGFTSVTDNTQNARIFRDGIASTCAAPKAVFPGTTAPGNRRFDAYSFTTCGNAGPSCVTVTLSGANAINLFTAAYTGTYNPVNIGQNYIADPGSSAASRTYSFNIPGGMQTFVIVVHEVNPGGAIGTAYNLNVSGSCVGVCSTPNEVPVAQCQNVTVSAGSDCTANASVNNGSFDADGDALTIVQSPAGPYPLGVTNVLLTVSDPRGATSQCTATVTVVDTTPPSISNASVDKPTLWPPNHAMHGVTVNYTVADNCSMSGAITCTLSVTSNEPVNGTGDGDTSPDWVVVDSHHVQLRAERAGTGSGRVYTITITCTDESNNTSTQTVTVAVSKNQASLSPLNLNMLATSTGTFWDVLVGRRNEGWDLSLAD